MNKIVGMNGKPVEAKAGKYNLTAELFQKSGNPCLQI